MQPDSIIRQEHVGEIKHTEIFTVKLIELSRNQYWSIYVESYTKFVPSFCTKIDRCMRVSWRVKIS